MCYPPQKTTTHNNSYVEFLIETANEFLSKNNKTSIVLGDFEGIMEKCKTLSFNDKEGAYELLKLTTAWIDFLQELKGYIQKQYLDCESDELYVYHRTANEKSPSNIAAGERAANMDVSVQNKRKEKNSYKALMDVISGKIEVINKAHYVSKLVMTNDQNHDN